MSTTPAHLAPDACYVCGGQPHADTTPTGGHRFWSNAAAAAEFKAAPSEGPTWADGVFAEEKPWPEVSA